jgi:chemotaxis protein methyltransferase CheR
MTMLSQQQFQRIASIAQERWGLHLPPKKMPLVSSRLSTFLRGSRFPDVGVYLDHLHHEASEEDMLVFFDLLSTNVTSFFRDRQHFDYLERELFTAIARGNLTLPGRAVRMWSAGCSTGPEAYSMAISASEHLREAHGWEVHILATDLSNYAVSTARSGEYEAKMLEGMSPDLVARHFERRAGEQGGAGAASGGGVCFAVRAHLRRMVRVARLNLMEQWPMRGPFDVIFCRNVMIYFDGATRERLVARFHEMLRPGGVFAVGSAETLSGLGGAGASFKPVLPSLYVK